tara:strand:- start:35 stop:937 length:903 start_codon:yes stop_codon:yes gene_type:complete
MKDVILITGDSGQLAGKINLLLSDSYEIRTLTTNKKKTNNKTIFYWDIKNKFVDLDALKNCKHIIHLAGYSIIKPWTKKNTELMYLSRVEGARLLFNKCNKLNIKPKTFITASAMGIYGLESAGEKNEKSKTGNDWVAQMAIDWEAAADQFKNLTSRIVKMRISLLISKNFSLVKYSILSTKFGITPIIGSKHNTINWIHIDDAAIFIKESITHKKYQGTFNISTQNPVSQHNFIKIIQKKVCPFALSIQIPEFLLKFILGKRYSIINVKLKLSANKLVNTGFKYKYNKMEEALENIINQ